MATPHEIKHVTERIVQLVETLVETNTMVRGSFSTVHRRCGKQTCWCADSRRKGHVTTRITWMENGVSRTKTLKEEDQQRFHEAIQTYRTYRRGRRRLRAQEKLLEELLDTYEQTAAKSPEDG